MRKNKTQNLYFWVLAIFAWVFLSSNFINPISVSPALALTIPTTAPTPVTGTGPKTQVCSEAKFGKGLTTRIIPCIRDSIIFGTSKFLQPFSTAVSSFITIAASLAIVVWGVSVASGKGPQITSGGMILGLKVGAVALMTKNFGNFYPQLLDAMEDLMNIIASPISKLPILHTNNGCPAFTGTGSDKDIASIWHVIDCYIDMLVGGIFSEVNLKQGIIGFLIGLLFSSAIGAFIALVGFFMVIICLFTIWKALYIFISSYIAISLMIVVSPITIPLVLFKSTKPYFDKWLNLLLNFMLQPMVLLGFLVMFLVAFNNTVFETKRSLYYAVANTELFDNNDKLKSSKSLGQWINDNGGFVEESVNAQGVKIDPAAAFKELGGKASNAFDRGTLDKQGKYNDKDVTNVFNSLEGNGSIAADPVLSQKFFKMDFAVDVIDWKALAKASKQLDTTKSQAEQDKQLKNYKLRIFFSFVMTLIVMYIFFSMMEYLPSIGTGELNGDDLNHIALGGHRFSSKSNNPNSLGKATGQ